MSSKRGLEIIAVHIARGLKYPRKVWFSAQVRAIQELREKHVKNLTSPKKIAKSKLGGEAEIAIKAFQILCVGNFIRSQKYLGSARIDEFIDILCKRVCGNKKDDCILYIENLLEKRKESEIRYARFSGEIAEYIMNDEDVLIERELIRNTVDHLRIMNWNVVANFFKDNDTLRKLDSLLHELQE